MKPNFALSLSFEGIRLLHRAADGWRVVGDVGLDSTDLAAELALLRTKASDLSVGALRTKLIIPNDQIKYISLETGEQELAERTRQALDALVGATPYDVEDLAYAVSADGPQTHIAAVAHETLAEAEAFAKEHRFHPVSWVSIPDDGVFAGEPFFGQTKSAAELVDGNVVEADDAKIVILGNVIADTGPVVAVDEDDIVPDLASKEDAPLEVIQPEVATPDIQINTPKESAPVVDPLILRENTASVEEETAGAPPIDAVPKVPDEPQDAPSETPTIVGFASRRAPEGKTPSLSGARRDTLSAGVAAASVPPIEDVSEVTPLVVTDAPEPRIAAGFLSRRKQPKSDAIPAPSAVTTKPSTEAQRLTIFGARKPDKKAVVGGKPRFLGLVLTAVLLLFLAGVAAWASVFMDEGLARFFGGPNERSIATAPAELAPPPKEEDAPVVTTASLSDGLSSEDAAVLDALRAPLSDPVAVLPELTPQELAANYAVTGIWAKAPEVPQPAALVPLDDLYVASIDPVSSANDTVALPDVQTFDTDRGIDEQSTPVAAGIAFALGPNGLVIPTSNGAISPDGVTVYLGRPAKTPPKTPVRLVKAEDLDPALAVIAKLRPQPRPGNLVEQNERSSNGGLSRTELAEQRPRARPALVRTEVIPVPEPEVAAETLSAQTDAATAAAAASLAALPAPTENIIEGPANSQAVRASVRPDGRPRNFARIVKPAIAQQPKDDASNGTRVASIAPRTVTPKVPSSASVAKSATVKNAINLRGVNLIGVYGKPSSRRALVRLSNGRYQKVQVGDRIDGGRVSAIGDSELRYKKGSRNLVLKMPKG